MLCSTAKNLITAFNKLSIKFSRRDQVSYHVRGCLMGQIEEETVLKGMQF